MSTKATILRVLRAERALTLDELATRSGLSISTLWRTEQGRSRPMAKTRRRIAAALGCDTALLVDRALTVTDDWAA